jgi:N-acetylmuramoyl-L-alanine amidase
MRIFIDAGHNYSGLGTGATGNGMKEQEITFCIADKLKTLLVSAGHQVKMSRAKLTDNLGKTVTEGLDLRAKMANDWGADLFASIHCNAFNGKAQGTETLVYSLESGSVPYAERIQKAIVAELGTKDREVKERPDLRVLKKTTMPALLVETAFIDNVEDALLLKNRQDDFAKAIFEGITGSKAVKGTQTVMKIPNNVYVQEIEPSDFRIQKCDCRKRHVGLPKYFNLGFFSGNESITVPVGNLVIDGKIITQAKDNESWINVSKKKLTTIYTTKNGECGITKTDTLDDDISLYRNIKTAVSGIPIIIKGKKVSLGEIKAEGYAGGTPEKNYKDGELYDTWHGFLGIRNGKLVYVAMKCGFDEMCWTLVALGIYDAIKVDGGGSFILHDEKEIVGTDENRRIHNVGVWKG